jgi:hypothetical protein
VDEISREIDRVVGDVVIRARGDRETWSELNLNFSPGGASGCLACHRWSGENHLRHPTKAAR